MALSLPQYSRDRFLLLRYLSRCWIWGHLGFLDSGVSRFAFIILKVSIMLIGTKAESFDRMKRNPTFFFCNATFSTGMPHNKKNPVWTVLSCGFLPRGITKLLALLTHAQNASKAACHRPRNGPLEPKLCMGQSITVGTPDCVIRNMTGT